MSSTSLLEYLEHFSFFLACARCVEGLCVFYVVNCLETIQSIAFSSSLDYNSLQKPVNSLGIL